MGVFTCVRIHLYIVWPRCTWSLVYLFFYVCEHRCTYVNVFVLKTTLYFWQCILYGMKKHYFRLNWKILVGFELFCRSWKCCSILSDALYWVNFVYNECYRNVLLHGYFTIILVPYVWSICSSFNMCIVDVSQF